MWFFIIVIILCLIGLAVMWKYGYFDTQSDIPDTLFDTRPPTPLPDEKPFELVYTPPKETVTVIASTTPVKKSNREHLYNVAYSCLGIDMAPTQDSLGCAEALYYVLKKAGVPNLPKKAIVSSYEMDKWCRKNLVRVAVPLFGDIISSPTGTGNGSIRGHVGILGKYKIMSNNSATFKWDDYFTLDSWRKRYERQGGIPTNFYRWP